MRIFFILAILLSYPSLTVADWPQFRGPYGLGTSPDTGIPENWSETENIAWKIPLPGVGASSPIVIGDKVFLTASEGGADDVLRHVLCFSLTDGRLLWDKTVDSLLPEQSKIREDHGYASSTPVATGDRLFVFFGKSGVFAFDHDGRQLWNTTVGSALNGWGSAASLTLHRNLVLVNASVEGEALVALDQTSGKEVWKVGNITESWHAPVLAPVANGRTEVIAALNGELRAFDAVDGKPLWQCKSGIGWYMCPMPLVQDGIVYAVGGRSGLGGLAVRTGGTGNVTETRRLWTLQKATNVPTPILHGGYLYFANDSTAVAHCVDIKTGEFLYSERLVPNPGGIYASPVLIGERILYLGRGGQAVFIAAKPEFKVLSSAVLENKRGMFNASPAVAGNRLLLRSNKFLYCIGDAPKQ
ncbi:MAG: PQQ-like beta-propeller repeat protein [Verrucomicrobiae bacterium]|nr:PQQ-like beta-propeller repeat protein [Verrucomicrobiae bacterium]